VVVEGETSEWVHVDSGVPQGTVLGLVLFLAFINYLSHLSRYVQAKVRLFADDCVVYRPVSPEEDCMSLQKDLEALEVWENKWLMSFNATKCNAIPITENERK
jgi:ribonuclease P/MRP protein subunit RPP40